MDASAYVCIENLKNPKAILAVQLKFEAYHDRSSIIELIVGAMLLLSHENSRASKVSFSKNLRYYLIETNTI